MAHPACRPCRVSPRHWRTIAGERERGGDIIYVYNGTYYISYIVSGYNGIYRYPYTYYIMYLYLVGGLEHFLFSPIVGMMIQSD